MGQLGHGDKVQRDMPTIVAGLSRHKIVRAGAGRSQSFAFGWNKHGRLGSGSARTGGQGVPQHTYKVVVLDHEKKRTFVIRKDGLPDAVVWNPWHKKAKALADFGNDEYNCMLCVEPASIEKPITLKPGQEWRGRMELFEVPSSYCSGQHDPQKVLGTN